MDSVSGRFVGLRLFVARVTGPSEQVSGRGGQGRVLAGLG